jgi:hypothetical protein
MSSELSEHNENSVNADDPLVTAILISPTGRPMTAA